MGAYWPYLVSSHPAGLGFQALAEPLPEVPLRGAQLPADALVENPHELEERELARQTVDDVAEALPLPLEAWRRAYAPSVRLIVFVAIVLCMCVYWT